MVKLRGETASKDQKPWNRYIIVILYAKPSCRADQLSRQVELQELTEPSRFRTRASRLALCTRAKLPKLLGVRLRLDPIPKTLPSLPNSFSEEQPQGSGEKFVEKIVFEGGKKLGNIKIIRRQLHFRVLG